MFCAQILENYHRFGLLFNWKFSLKPHYDCGASSSTAFDFWCYCWWWMQGSFVKHTKFENILFLSSILKYKNSTAHSKIKSLFFSNLGIQQYHKISLSVHVFWRARGHPFLSNTLPHATSYMIMCRRQISVFVIDHWNCIRTRDSIGLLLKH